MILLLACHPSVDTGTPDSPDVTTSSVPRVELPEIAAPEDLDPSPSVLHVSLTAEEDGENYAYNGQRPGPLLIAPVNSTLIVDFQNRLPIDSTIHWHGIAAPEAMDGVVWLQQPVPRGGSFTYTIPLDHPGTFWYHPHVDVAQQVDRGLYGAIVVTDPEDPPVSQDRVLVFDAIGETVSADDHGLLDPQNLRWTVNGVENPLLRLEGPQTLRLRLINAANLAYLDLSLPEILQIAGDQGLRGVTPTDRLILAPGDRADLEFRASESLEILTTPFVPSGATRLDPQPLFGVEVQHPGAPPAPLSWPAATAPTPDPGSTDLLYVLTGDGKTWKINGTSWPEVPILRAPLGQPTVVEIRNLSSTHHPFHLHGNAFEVLSRNGVPPAVRTTEDTEDIPIQGILRLLLTPDNPGDWMLHCHLLEHEEGGMMAVLRVD